MLFKFSKLRKIFILIFVFIMLAVLAGNVTSAYAKEGNVSKEENVSGHSAPLKENVIHKTEHAGISSSSVVIGFILITFVMIGILSRQAIKKTEEGKLTLKLNIGSKILGSFIIVILIFGIVSLFGIIKLGHIGDELKEIAEEDMPLIEVITAIETHQLEQVINLERIFRFAENTAKGNKAKAELEKTEKYFQKYAELLEKAEKNFEMYAKMADEEIIQGEKIAEEAIQNAVSLENKKEFEHVLSVLKTIEKEHQDFDDHARTAIKLANEGRITELHELEEKIEAEEEHLNHEIEGFLKEVEKFTATSIKKAENDEISATRMIIILSLIAIIVGIFLGEFITRKISNPIKKGVGFAQTIADGDLTQELKVTAKDEIGDLAVALNTMVEKLRNVVSSISESSDQVAASSEELTKTAQNLSEGSQKQAASLEESSSSMEEMTSSVEQISEKAQNQASSVEEVTSTIEELTSSIKGVFENSQKIKEGAENSLTQSATAEESSSNAIEGMKKIEDSSNKIKNIIDVINDIADQTNLLALNASVEAARAGDAGRGFAVVAQEISKLADRSAGATKEIAELIAETGLNVDTGSKMVTELDGAIKKMKEISETVAQYGQEMANATEEQLNGSKQVSEAIQNVNQMSQAIASASEEQSSTTQETSKTIEGVNQITQEAASSAEEMASSTEELSSQAENMKQVVSQFKINEENQEQKPQQEQVQQQEQQKQKQVQQ